jgi:micrococcal nuclease
MSWFIRQRGGKIGGGQSLPEALAPPSPHFYNTPPCEALMTFTVRPLLSIALRFHVTLVLSIVCLPTPAWADFTAGVDGEHRAAIFTSPVVRVIEGDTIEVLHNNHPELIRLNGIDCPEKGQAFGLFAEHAAADLVFRKQVTLQTHGLDEYGSTIGDVILPDGMHLNQELVRRGLCWWYRKYAPGDAVLEQLEKAAREAKKGLWADPQSVAPWEWRKRR